MKIIAYIFPVIFISLFFNFIYYAFFTYSKYSGKAQYIPSIIVPLIVVVLIAIGIIYAKYVIKIKMLASVGYSLIIVISFFLVFNLVHAQYSYLFQHYYQKFPYDNLLHLHEYSNEKGNYFTIKNVLDEHGITVTNIADGNTENHDPNIVGTPNTKMIYYINKELYIIFDWDKKTISTSVDKQDLKAIVEEKLAINNADIIQYESTFISLRENNGDIINKKIVPSEDGTIDLIDV